MTIVAPGAIATWRPRMVVPFTVVPFDDRSVSNHPVPTRSMTACTRETDFSGRSRSLPSRRPIVNRSPVASGTRSQTEPFHTSR